MEIEDRQKRCSISCLKQGDCFYSQSGQLFILSGYNLGHGLLGVNLKDGCTQAFGSTEMASPVTAKVVVSYYSLWSEAE